MLNTRKPHAPPERFELRFNVSRQVINALRKVAKDTGLVDMRNMRFRKKGEPPPVEAYMAPEIAAQLLEGALIDALAKRYKMKLGDFSLP